jgi:hypothetical protein
LKKISIFGDFFRCLIPCADKNAPAVGLRQNPDKNAMKWPKNFFIRTKDFGSGILGGCRGSYVDNPEISTDHWHKYSIMNRSGLGRAPERLGMVHWYIVGKWQLDPSQIARVTAL